MVEIAITLLIEMGYHCHNRRRNKERTIQFGMELSPCLKCEALIILNVWKYRFRVVLIHVTELAFLDFSLAFLAWVAIWC